jgi:hypothetical protein
MHFTIGGVNMFSGQKYIAVAFTLFFLGKKIVAMKLTGFKFNQKIGYL